MKFISIFLALFSCEVYENGETYICNGSVDRAKAIIGGKPEPDHHAGIEKWVWEDITLIGTQEKFIVKHD